MMGNMLVLNQTKHSVTTHITHNSDTNTETSPYLAIHTHDKTMQIIKKPLRFLDTKISLILII